MLSSREEELILISEAVSAGKVREWRWSEPDPPDWEWRNRHKIKTNILVKKQQERKAAEITLTYKSKSKSFEARHNSTARILEAVRIRNLQNEDKRLRITFLLKQGFRNTEIAAEVGCSYHWVRKIAISLNLPKNKTRLRREGPIAASTKRARACRDRKNGTLP